MRDDEERTEARRSLSFLQSLRQAIPASLDNSTATKDAYENFEANLVARANGKPDATKQQLRYTASKNTRKKPARRAPQPVK